LYLAFKLSEEFHALPILKVQEIIGFQSVTPIPGMPRFVCGVINLRDKVIPVVDLRLRFAMTCGETTSRTCIIIVHLSQNHRVLTLGAIVDEVCEVIELPQSQIEPAPEFGASVDTRFILGIGKNEQRVILLLDVDRLFSDEEMAKVSHMGAQD